MQELIFPVEQEKDGSFIVRAPDKSVLVRAESMPELKGKIFFALRQSLPQGTRVRVRFPFEKVRTLSLIALVVLLALSGFAWQRREDLRSLRHARGRISLTTSQCFVVAAFVIGLSFTVTLVAILPSNH